MSIKYSQSDFVGGMDMSMEATKVASNKYPFLVNGRARYNVIEPVKLPVDLTDELPPGKIQGIYGAENYLIVFVAGTAYIKDYSVVGSSFAAVVGLAMDATVDTIYAQVVPVSSDNYQRKQTTASDNSSVNKGLLLPGSAAGLIVQDGTNQPWKILSNGSAVIAKTFTDWTKDTDQEYVPIGRMMMYSGDGILYLTSPRNVDGFSNEIYRSVSGRPIDFMINIDTNGDKALSETLGGAATVSYSVGFDNITSINDLGSADGTFLVGTLRYAFLVIPDYTNLIFGEPRFSNYVICDKGPINSFSVIDVGGDTAFINQVGITSFNAISVSKLSSRTNAFARPIAQLFNKTDLVQTVTCAINFDRYGLFAVDTIHGPLIAVYDIDLGAFVAVDKYPGVGYIKQFASIHLAASHRLFFITNDNKFYEMFTGDEAVCRLYLGEWCSGAANISQKVQKLDLAFTEILESGNIELSLFVDGQRINTQVAPLVVDPVTVPITPVDLPFQATLDKKSYPISFRFDSAPSGWKVGFFISWDFKAKLAYANALSESLLEDTSDKQKLITNSTYVSPI